MTASNINSLFEKEVENLIPTLNFIGVPDFRPLEIKLINHSIY